VPPRFLVDVNVGRLVTWLRALGYDAVRFRGGHDNEMVKFALEQGRVILTKDGELLRRRVTSSGRLRVVHIDSDDFREQLRQVVREVRLKDHRPFTRCLECNQPLAPRSREEVAGKVPPYVFATQREFSQCPTCLRIYWQGTHWQAMNSLFRELEGWRG